VCVCVCLSVRENISGTTGEIFTKILMHVAYDRGSASSGVVAIRYVLPVLWMTLCCASIAINIGREATSDIYDCLVVLFYVACKVGP